MKFTETCSVYCALSPYVNRGRVSMEQGRERIGHGWQFRRCQAGGWSEGQSRNPGAWTEVHWRPQACIPGCPVQDGGSYTFFLLQAWIGSGIDRRTAVKGCKVQETFWKEKFCLSVSAMYIFEVKRISASPKQMGRWFTYAVGWVTFLIVVAVLPLVYPESPACKELQPTLMTSFAGFSDEHHRARARRVESKEPFLLGNSSVDSPCKYTAD